MHSAAWQRALLLMGQGRHDLAAGELRRLLAEDPDFAPAHALLAQALVGQDELDAALVEARRAVGLGPDLPFAHYVLGVVHWRREELDAATAALGRAVELDPDDADHHAMLAQVRVAQKRWSDALAAVDAGLRLDPEHVDCLNLRSIALVKLGRAGEATDALDASLARDPDNPYTHQARGFALLHRGDARAAVHHFQEALRRDPTLDGARAGLVEALKARNPVYRLLLGWMLWMERFSAGRQQQILIGAWLVMFLSRRALSAAGHGAAENAVGLVWIGIVLFTVCTVPVFNLLLLLHPLGRHALDRQSRIDALLLGTALVLLAAVLLHGWFGESAWSQEGWWFFLFLLMPVAGIGVFGPGWGRITLQVFVVALLASFLWWAWSFESLLAELRTDALGGSAHARVRQIDVPRLRDKSEQMWTLALGAALSSWFVLLAPKGSRRRGRR